MRRFPAPDLPALGARVVLDAEVSHHLLRVTVIARGERVGLFDAAGRDAVGVLVDVAQGHAVVEIVEIVERGAAPDEGAPCWLLVGLLKPATFDEVVRMATELGVTHLWPFLAERSVPRGERVDRWARIAASAVTQCGRTRPPELRAPAALRELLAELPEGLTRRVYVPGASRLEAPRGPSALLIGPEGGLTPREIDEAEGSGFTPEGLGPWTLRADTAVVSALARRS